MYEIRHIRAFLAAFFGSMKFQSVSSSSPPMCPLFTEQSQCWMQDPSHMTLRIPGDVTSAFVEELM
jgi:hypothetical protein